MLWSQQYKMVGNANWYRCVQITVQERVKQKRKQWLLQVAALWGTNCGKFLIFEITEWQWKTYFEGNDFLSDCSFHFVNWHLLREFLFSNLQHENKLLRLPYICSNVLQTLKIWSKRRLTPQFGGWDFLNDLSRNFVNICLLHLVYFTFAAICSKLQ